MLEVDGIDVYYDDFHVLHSVSLTVGHGEAVGLIGANGHGKSTLLKAVCGLVPVRSGTIRFDGEIVNRLGTPARVRRGMVYVAEERHLFPDMSVLENLLLGAYLPPSPQGEDFEPRAGLRPVSEASRSQESDGQDPERGRGADAGPG